MRESSTEAGTEKRYYIEGLEIVDDEIILQKMAEGRIVFEGDSANDTNEPEARYQYTLSDHLGNTMVLFEDRDNNGVIIESPNPSTSEVLQRELYYPFGLQFRGTAPLAAEPAQNYLYNGKEQVEGTGLYAYGFRYYDPVIGRFTGVDPIADQFAHLSGFNYASNDPIGKIDLYGLQGVQFNKLFNENGKTKTRTIVQLSLHIGISSSGNGYSSSDVVHIKANLEKEYNRDGNYFKVKGQKVMFEFDIQTFDVDKTSLTEKSNELLRSSVVNTDSPLLTPEGNPVDNDGVIVMRKSITAAAIGLSSEFSKDVQGGTRANRIGISTGAIDVRHTEAHELGHFMLTGDSRNPNSPEEHNLAGGIFQYAIKDPGGYEEQGTLPVNRGNVKKILSNIPRKKE